MMNKVIKVKEAAKKNLRKMIDNRKWLACAVTYGMMQTNMMVCHASAKSNKVTSGLNNLKTLVLAIIGTVGIIYLAKSVMEFASAYQQSDSSGMNSAAKGIAGGLMMAAISSIIGILGFK